MDDFYAGATTTTESNLRDVSSVAGTPAVGQSLCTNGITNHKTCQEVRAVNVCSGSVCDLVEMGRRDRAPGDSGGPVYWGNTAYGLHHGWKYEPWPADRDLFSQALRIDDALGVYVATS